MSVENSKIKKKIKNNLFSDTEHGALIDLRARPPQVKRKGDRPAGPVVFFFPW